MRLWFAALAALVAQPAAAQGFAEVRDSWAQARERAAEDAAAALPLFERAIAASPGNATLLRSAMAAAIGHDPARLRAWLEHFIALGGTLGEESRAVVMRELGVDAHDPLIAALLASRVVIAAGETVATLPATIQLVEGVARDGVSGAVYVSSVVGRTIQRVDGAGAPVTLAMPDTFGAPMALAHDDARHLLWAGLDPEVPGAPPGARGGLLRLETRGGGWRLVDAGEGIALHIGDVTLGDDGTIYAADSRNGGVYRCAPGCAVLETLVAPGVLGSAQGMAVSGDGKHLYVADYRFGVARVDLATRAVRAVATAPGVALDGIDGMLIADGRLIAVQNGWTPARVIAVTLDPSGLRAERIDILARNDPRFDDPTQIARDGDAVLLVANAQWARYENAADPRSVSQQPAMIVRIPVAR